MTPTYNDHVMISSHLVHVSFILQHIIILVVLCLILLIMEEKEEMVGRQFNSFEELDPLV